MTKYQPSVEDAVKQRLLESYEDELDRIDLVPADAFFRQPQTLFNTLPYDSEPVFEYVTDRCRPPSNDCTSGVYRFDCTHFLCHALATANVVVNRPSARCDSGLCIRVEDFAAGFRRASSHYDNVKFLGTGFGSARKGDFVFLRDLLNQVDHVMLLNDTPTSEGAKVFGHSNDRCGEFTEFDTSDAYYFRIEEAARSLSTNGNVDTSARDSDRVRVMWGLIGTVVEDLDSHRTEAERLNIKKFLLHVAWHEGDKLRFRTQQPRGPGRSFFQFEPAKAKDAVDHAQGERLMDKLTSSSGEAERALLDAAAALRLGAPWPANNLIEKELGNTDPSDLFATYMTRIALKRIRTAGIPTSNPDHAEYWARHWKISFSSADERARQVASFTSKADTVDGLIPSD